MEAADLRQRVVVRKEEGGAWFWKLFGGTIISVISVLLVLIISTISSNINQANADAKEASRRLEQEVSVLKEKQTALEQLVKGIKERLMALEAALKEQALTGKEQDKQIFELKEKILKLETLNKSDKK